MFVWKICADMLNPAYHWTFVMKPVNSQPFYRIKASFPELSVSTICMLHRMFNLCLGLLGI